MTRDAVREIVLAHVRAVLVDVPPEQITADKNLTELGANSIDRVEVATSAMEDLGLVIPAPELVGLANIDALIDLLHGRLSHAVRHAG